MYLLLLLMMSIFEAAMAVPTTTLGLNCQAKCGNVSIPYPFGIGTGCHKEGFDITCNDSYGPPKPFIGRSKIELIDISLLQGHVRIYKHIAWACYDLTGAVLQYRAPISLQERAVYRFSDTLNKFTAIGCNTLAYISGGKGRNFASGCVSLCDSIGSVTNGSCAGIGCCQTAIPKGLTNFKAYFDPAFKQSSVWQFNPCSYAFLVDQNWYKFQSSDLVGQSFSRANRKRVPVVLDWAIGNQNCREAKNNMSSFACVDKNSECYDSRNGPGYLCNCTAGYQGNPYLLNGCQDINECELPHEYPCYGICKNTLGSYNCSCPPGTKGDPFIQYGCFQVVESSVKLVIEASSLIMFMIIIGFWIYMGVENRKLIRVRRRFFKQNGGFLLQQQLTSQDGSAFKIFKKDELERATDKFDIDRVIGCGGHGTVYKGVLEDDRIVAIKKSKVVSESQNKEFAKEMHILSQVNHKHVVKLLGCCLEVEVPMLVYEFVTNGTLYHHIHENNHKLPLSLGTRLRIALESAEALAYLHSSATTPIIHGDVKSSNILLDCKYRTKVSDFGASKLAPMDKTQLATLVRGTCGYLDPEYLQTCQLTEKSDVYSFGVVLLELLTGKKALYLEASGAERSLALTFILAMKENRILEILDKQVKLEGEIETLREIAQLAAECLKIKGEERPTMKEVAERLERLRKTTSMSEASP